MFNAASQAAAGHEGLALELRVRTAVELGCISELYRCMYPKFGMIADDVEIEMMKGAREGAWATALQMVTLASVLEKAIHYIPVSERGGGLRRPPPQQEVSPEGATPSW